nr:HNH endonuclease [Paenarthrobacter aurescens]
MPVRERFYSRTVRRANGCLEWIGFRKASGHGMTSLNGKTMHASRAAFVLETQTELTTEQHVLHTCDNPACVEIGHLYVGDNKQNVSDKIARGRARTPTGAANNRTVLTEAQIEEIRSRRARGETLREISVKVGCSPNYAGQVARGMFRAGPPYVRSEYAAARAEQRARAGATQTTEVTPLPGEEWRASKFEGYTVSNLGRVIGRQGFVLKQSTSPTDPRPVVGIGGTPVRVHVIVCEAFHGPRPPGQEAAHFDGNPANNRSDNLRWATRLDNENDKKRHGTYYGRGLRKLTAKDAKSIRSELAKGKRGIIARLAEKYGVSRGAIVSIRDGKTWISVVND